jgi:plastocyanin
MKIDPSRDVSVPGLRHRISLSLLAGFAVLLFAASSGCRRASAGTEPPAVTHHVLIENMKFTPAIINLRPGDKIEFKNQDLVPHTVTEKGAAPAFDSGAIPMGTTWDFTAGHAGTFTFRCTFHPTMEGSIIVSAP